MGFDGRSFSKEKIKGDFAKEGDRNTKFFHKINNVHKRINFITKIKVNVDWLTKENKIKERVAWAFHILLFDLGDWIPCINGISFKALDVQEAEKLELPFFEEEVFSALSNLNRDKGPNGFSIVFQQFRKNFIKDQVMSFF